jgi:serine/threonine protein kinase/tetratricopeptide (TPR) repeat protein
MPLSPGMRLGPYEILAPLGAGGMGEVYRAKDTRLGREVAVKVLPKFSADSQEALARFEREARAVAALSHPNIMAIHDFGSEGGVAYSVTELLEGESLRDRLDASAIPPRKAIEYVQQIARGLAAAHDRGIAHRDLKPDNVFLTRDGLVKILDFGLAREIPGSEKSGSGLQASLTASGTVVGTPGYMSPEQIRGKPVDQRTDLFALGAILYEMLTGQRAFQRGSPVETMMAVLQEDPPASGGRPVPPELAAIVSHCMEKNPEDRFQSARDFAFALQVADRELSGARTPTPSAALPVQQTGTSVAVLPFRNLSADPEADYFSDGMTEEIINALTGIEDLRVAARTSSFAFKGKDADVRRIGEELGVRTVLEGSVRQAGRRIRITVQLVDAESGYQLWSERYDREMEDVFAVQDEIARAIADRLKVRLAGSGEHPLVKAPTDDVEAYDLYLRGRHFWNLRRPRPAIECFEAAIVRDPKYVAAYTGLADAYSVWGFYGGIPTLEARRKATDAAEKARMLAPGEWDVHLSLGVIEHYYGWDTAVEEQELRLAIDRNPRATDAYFWLALCLGVSGRFEEAAEIGRQGVALDPHSANARAALAWAYGGARKYETAVREFTAAVALDPAAPFPLWSLGYMQQQAGALSEAVATLERVVAITERRHYFELALLGGALAAAGRRNDAESILAEIREAAAREYVPPFDMAVLLASLGDKEGALEALERAYADRNALLWYRIHLPTFDVLRSEPRWQALAGELGKAAPIGRGGVGDTIHRGTT